MDLVRLLLLAAESADAPFDARELDLGAHGPEEVAYHVEMMAAHGLLDADVHRAYADDRPFLVSCAVRGLTWDGADYLDAVRDERIWARTKKKVAEVASSVTIGTLKDAAVMVAKAAIAANIGA